jgi:hypothetical protein
MKTLFEKLNENSGYKKTIKFDLEGALKDLFYESEGVGHKGWTCPIWAKIENDDLYLSLGQPGKNYSFKNPDGSVPLSWVDNIDCWDFPYTKDDWEELGYENPEDFDYDQELLTYIEQMVNNMMKSNEIENIKDDIEEFCHSKGYEVKFV